MCMIPIKNSKHMRQKLTELKWEIVQQTIIVIDFNSPFQELVEHLDQKKKKKNQTW